MNADELLFYLSHGFQLSQERRADIRADLQERQAHTDRLMAMSGQPLQEEPETQQNKRNIQNFNFWKKLALWMIFCRTEGMNRCPTTVPREVRRIFNPRFRFSVELVESTWANIFQELSLPRALWRPKDVTQLTDFRGLVHVRNLFLRSPCKLKFLLKKHLKLDKFRNFCLRQTTNWP